MEIKGGTYQQECPVIFGRGALNGIAGIIKQYNGSKAFCIYDGGVKAAGIADRLIKLLEDGGIKVFTFDGVKPDPVDADVDVAGELARKSGVDLVIGIGGGSTMDTAKMVAVMLKNPGSIKEYFLTTGKVPTTAPTILIPTASGTGSEVTRVAVVSEAGSHAKGGVFASATAAILDPELTLTCPAGVTASSGFDAMAHAFEAYTAAGSDPMSDLLSIEAIRLITANIKKAFDNGKDIDARTALSIGSNFAGIAFSNTGVHFGHAIGHQLGGVFHLPHGLACAYALADVAEFGSKASTEKGYAIAKAMGIEIEDKATGAEIGAKIGNEIRSMMKYCKMPSMKEKGITREGAIACAEDAVATNPFFYNTLAPLSVEEFKGIIGHMYDSYQ